MSEPFQRSERHNLSSDSLLNKTVPFVRRMPLDQHLSGDEPVARFTNSDVDVWTAKSPLQSVLDRLDRSEEILTFGVRDKAAVTLEVGVVRSAGACPDYPPRSPKKELHASSQPTDLWRPRL